MAKGQKRSSRETRKPKQEKPKVEAPPHSFSEIVGRVGGKPSGSKRSGG